MLKYLHIENIAVIEKTDIDLSEGFNVLTGETGAGKSIVIDSINAVLGERTSKELIRNGCDCAEVSALFGALSDYSVAVLKENGFEPDDDGNITIRRVLSLNGKGSIKINGKPATAGILKNITNSLVNIHGQHDSQGLLNPDLHYTYIDSIAENSALLDEYYAEFKYLNKVRKELESIETDEDKKRRDTELLTYQINELETADIKVGEIEKLKEQVDIAKNYQKMLTALNNALYLLNGTDDKDGAVSMLMNAQKFVHTASPEKFEDVLTKINNTLISVDDICSDIRKFTENSEYSNLDFENISNRLEILKTLMLKYGNSEEKMLQYLEDARTKLENITLSDKRLMELSDELDRSTERLIALGEKVTLSRKEAAKRFSAAVTETLQYLYMPNVKFDVDIQKGRYTKFGCDLVEFKICTNVGEESKPLHKIASGGELSRIMLAIKSVLTDKDNVDTLIFDEIDTGISGRAAGAVAVQLKKVSSMRQVICVTHLAQIAAFADNHFLIEKSVNNNRTFTQVNTLGYNDRIEEIARIMSGTDITENLYNSAKELLDRSKI